MMSEAIMRPITVIARKDISDASRDRFILIVTIFLTVAAIASLVAGAIALATDVATYNNALATLMALGKSADAIRAPEFYPLRLLRGAIEQIEIVGAVIAMLIGYRAAASERGRQTLTLIMTRPVYRWQFLAAKALAGLVLLAGGLFVVLFLCSVALHLVSGVGLSLADLGRIGLVWAVSVTYTACFFLVSFMLTLMMKRPPHALLASFSIWLILVLIAPQIGDTLDPDNQVAGGVFAQLHITKADQLDIMQGFASFEAVRTGIEAVSITKHFERFAFAVLGIKDTYAGQPLGPILIEKQGDLLWILISFVGLVSMSLALPTTSDGLTKE